MTSYTVTALSVEQKGPSAGFVVALCVSDINGSGVGNLNEGDFTVRSLTSDTHFAVTKLQRTGLQGFYLLSLRAEPAANVGEHILALVIAHHHAVGRVPGDTYTANTLLKVSVA